MPEKRRGRASARDREPARADSFAVLSIGALSRATGVPVETLRTWERRYGFPKPVARESAGHRRYPLEAVSRLRLVVRALEDHHAPSVVLRATPEALHDLVEVTRALPDEALSVPARVGPAPPGDEAFLARCTKHVVRLDGDDLAAELDRAWNELGGLDCLVSHVGPFLTAIGEAWSRKDLEVGHEHFVSEHVREFLSARWRPMSERSLGPRVVCAAVAGELHVLGLHMAATTLALAGAQLTFLGACTPPEDVVRAVRDLRAHAVALSAASGTSARRLRDDLGTLRDAIPASVPVVVGGGGFDGMQDRQGVSSMSDLRELYRWAVGLARQAS